MKEVKDKEGQVIAEFDQARHADRRRLNGRLTALPQSRANSDGDVGVEQITRHE